VMVKVGFGVLVGVAVGSDRRDNRLLPEQASNVMATTAIAASRIPTRFFVGPARFVMGPTRSFVGPVRFFMDLIFPPELFIRRSGIMMR
jgi:hypothetical protein